MLKTLRMSMLGSREANRGLPSLALENQNNELKGSKNAQSSGEPQTRVIRLWDYGFITYSVPIYLFELPL